MDSVLAGVQLGARGADQHQGAGELLAVARQNLFLQRQHRLQRVRAGQKLADPGQGQAQALEGQDLVQPGNLVRAIDAPAGLGPQRLEQTVALVQAQRLDADAEAPGGLAGTEVGTGMDVRVHAHRHEGSGGRTQGPGQAQTRPHPSFSYK